jgi:hypothetical protein
VDGRNRLKACQIAGVAPRFIEWREVYNGQQSLSEWIWTQNGARRQMTPDQKVAAYVALHRWEEAERAQQRRAPGGVPFRPPAGSASVPRHGAEPAE